MGGQPLNNIRMEPVRESSEGHGWAAGEKLRGMTDAEPRLEVGMFACC